MERRGRRRVGRPPERLEVVRWLNESSRPASAPSVRTIVHTDSDAGAGAGVGVGSARSPHRARNLSVVLDGGAMVERRVARAAVELLVRALVARVCVRSIPARLVHFLAAAIAFQARPKYVFGADHTRLTGRKCQN